MGSMLVLLNRPEDIEDRLSELQEIAINHKVEKIYLASISRAFGSRVRSRVSPQKLDMAVQMSNEATGRYLAIIANTLRERGVDAEVINRSIPTEEVDQFVQKSNFDLLVGAEGFSKLPSCKKRFIGVTGMRLGLRSEI